MLGPAAEDKQDGAEDAGAAAAELAAANDRVEAAQILVEEARAAAAADPDNPELAAKLEEAEKTLQEHKEELALAESVPDPFFVLLQDAFFAAKMYFSKFNLTAVGFKIQFLSRRPRTHRRRPATRCR